MKSHMLVAAFWNDSTVFSRTLRPGPLLAPEPLCLRAQFPTCEEQLRTTSHSLFAFQLSPCKSFLHPETAASQPEPACMHASGLFVIRLAPQKTLFACMFLRAAQQTPLLHACVAHEGSNMEGPKS